MRDDASTGARLERISSPANPTIKLARSLHRKRVRSRERAVLVEGIRALSTAVEHRARVRALLIDESRVSDIDPDHVASLTDATERTLLVDPSIFVQLTDTEHPQPLIAICDMPDTTLPIDCSFVLALDNVRDPGNLGTLIRSAAAAGADGVALLHGTVDPWNPKAIRASVGSIFSIPVAFFAGVSDIVDRCFSERPSVAITESEGADTYDAVDWRRPSLVVIGGEAAGTSTEVRTYADISVQIPMAPGIESLNAAVAGSIIAFEVARQRRTNR